MASIALPPLLISGALPEFVMVKYWGNLLLNLTSATLMKTKHIGSNFDDFLKEEFIFDQSSEVAIKRVMTWKIEQELIKQKLIKTMVAKKIHAS